MSVQSLSLLEQHFYPCLIPLAHEMYVKNSDELKNVQLCSFLQEMDNQERTLQDKPTNARITLEELAEEKCRVEIINRSICQILFDPVGGGFGAIFGGLMGGPIGAALMGGIVGLGAHMFVLENRARRHSAMDAGRPRINRMISKIEKIKEKKLNLDHTIDPNQLNIAEDYLQRKVDRYNFLKSTTLTGSYNSSSLGFTHTYYDRDGNYHISGTIQTHHPYRVANGTVYETRTHHFNQ
ncbi:putative membrane protein [Candidatus Protochlamydia naegleriophila]|uniref:Putative membrane protein n=1 Tax=Candidatus Protochlamydia naegleriophila TaxID=389348 RepID=A0A0U5JBI8_9BACT|nr:hypothetical protein [Candidatus Protochlamydia naegleriophila]CUI15727.1 putative membrane protein [Candidatus Protochlamydia naegleriophila]